jgi:hypothetical protein
VPNVLRRFLAMTGRVPIIHVADTAFTIGQGAQEGQRVENARDTLQAASDQIEQRREMVWVAEVNSPSFPPGARRARVTS